MNFTIFKAVFNAVVKEEAKQKSLDPLLGPLITFATLLIACGCVITPFMCMCLLYKHNNCINSCKEALENGDQDIENGDRGYDETPKNISNNIYELPDQNIKNAYGLN